MSIDFERAETQNYGLAPQFMKILPKFSTRAKSKKRLLGNQQL